MAKKLSAFILQFQERTHSLANFPAQTGTKTNTREKPDHSSYGPVAATMTITETREQRDKDHHDFRALPKHSRPRVLRLSSNDADQVNIRDGRKTATATRETRDQREAKLASTTTITKTREQPEQARSLTAYLALPVECF